MSPIDFRELSRRTRVVGDDGLPLMVFRGEHGTPDPAQRFQVRRGSITFGSVEAANLYASEPNDEDAEALAPRVIAAYLHIERPFIHTDDDPFIDLGLIRANLGAEQARRIALKFASSIEPTARWREVSTAKGVSTVEEFLDEATDDELDELYFEAYRYFDDPVEVSLMKAAGFDGAIHGGIGENALEAEYRVFDPNQVIDALSVRERPVASRSERNEPEQDLGGLDEFRSARSAVSRVRAAVAELIGSDGLELSEGLGRLVVSSVREVSVPGHFAYSEGALRSFARSPAFQQMLAEKRAAKQRAIEAIGKIEDCAIVRHSSGDNTWRMILRDASEPGKWRTQSFDLKGFSGHMVFDSKEDAIDSAASQGYTIRDDSALDRIQDTPSFQRGLYVTDLIARVNTKAITYQEADRLLAQYDQAALALASIAECGAQAFIAAGGDTIYLLADRIEPGTEQGVVLHEIVHRYGMKILGRQGFEAMTSTIKGWSDRPSRTVERAIFEAADIRAREADGSLGELYEEELFCYAVEEAVSLGVKPSALAYPDSASQWLDQVVSTLRGVIHQAAGEKAARAVDVQAAVDLAYAFAQLENPRRLDRILDRMTAEERAVIEAAVGRNAEPLWYSQLEMRVLTQGQERMPAQQWASWIRAQVSTGVKPDEIHWSGVCDWLGTMDPKGLVSRSSVLSFIRANGVRVQEVIAREKHDSPEFLAAGSRLAVELTAIGWEPRYTSREGRLNLSSIVRVSDQKEHVWTDGAFVSSDGEEPPLAAQRLGVALLDLMDREAIPASQRDVSARYALYQLPGGTNYREVLLTLPVDESKEGSSQPYHSPHWRTPNVLAHVRLNERLDVDGKRVLFVEEIQSDWARMGRDQGFRREPKELVAANVHTISRGFLEIHDESGNFITNVTEDQVSSLTPELAIAEAWNRVRSNPARTSLLNMAPAGPFVTSTDKWVSLAVKRIMRMAVDGGYDSVAFINGDLSVERYGLEHRVESIQFDMRPGDHAGELTICDHAGESTYHRTEVSLDELSQIIGSDLARQLFDSRAPGYMNAPEIEVYALAGLDVLIGGRGMRVFYDSIVPKVVEDVVEKFGGQKLTKISIELGDESPVKDFLGFDVTPRMAEVARLGMPMFSFAREGVSASTSPEIVAPPIAPPVESVFPSTLKNWFGQSVVTVDGLPADRPLMVFRGAEPASGLQVDDGQPLWATSSRVNASAGLPGEIQNLYLKLENPLVVRSLVAPPGKIAQIAMERVAQGEAAWDGVIFEDVAEGGHPSVVYAVFPKDGAMGHAVELVGVTGFKEDGEPLYIGLQPPGDPSHFDRGDEIRHDLDWVEVEQARACQQVIETWRADAVSSSFSDGVRLDVGVARGSVVVYGSSATEQASQLGHDAIVLAALCQAADRKGVILEVDRFSIGPGLNRALDDLGFSWAGGRMTRFPGGATREPMTREARSRQPAEV